MISLNTHRTLCVGISLWLAITATAALAATPVKDEAKTVRVATFNIWELSAEKLDRVDANGRGQDPQLRSAAAVIQHIRPEVMLLNEIDYSAERNHARLFIDRYLAFSQDGQEPISYPFIVFEPSNTGVPSGFDLNGDEKTDGPEDCWGFGRYPGQYAMALLSQHPVDTVKTRTFRMLRWSSMPRHLIPDGRNDRPYWYAPWLADHLRLSSKSHWDVPIRVAGQQIHFLASHPTPGGFDGDEDRNGRRNFDEIRFWSNYLTGGDQALYIVDDKGRRGGFAADASFIVLGDLNADPIKDPAPYGRTAISQLLEHPKIQPLEPLSEGPQPVTEKRPYAGNPQTRTSSWGRIDYVLPSRDLKVAATGIFFPADDDPRHRLVVGDERASDHWLVWVDLSLGTPTEQRDTP